MKDRKKNFLFVVCHPDDEALWCGGMIYEFSRTGLAHVHVLCLSGKDANSPREKEFHDAKTVAGYKSGIVLGKPLRKADEPLPSIEETIKEGIRELRLDENDLDLVITHSPYGDEHLHPHHGQAHFGAKKWAKKNGIPFAFFSTIPIVHLRHQNLLIETRRKETLQVLSYGKCCHRAPILFYLFDLFSWVTRTRPKYFIQFLTHLETKIKMLNCYTSVVPSEFEQGYAMFTNPCELLYLEDKKGLNPFLEMMKGMKIPNSPVLFKGPVFLQKVERRLKKWFSGTDSRTE